MNEHDLARHLPNREFVQYQTLRAQEEDLRKRAQAMYDAADKLGELALDILNQYPTPDSNK